MRETAQAAAPQAPDAIPTEPWIKPELSRLRAGDAAFGATPLVPEGMFGTGS